MFNPKPIAFLLVIFSCTKQVSAQQEIVPLPLDKIDRDSLNLVIQSAEHKKDHAALGKIYAGISNYYLLSSYKDSGIKYLVKAEENAYRAGDSTRYYFLQLHKGEFYAGLDFKLSKLYYEKALKYYENTKNYSLSSNALSGLCYAYELHKDTVNMLKYLVLAEEANKFSKDTHNIVIVNDKRVNILISENKLDSAINLLNKNLSLINHTQTFWNSENVRTFWRGWQLNKIADCYYRKKNYQAALRYLYEAIPYNSQTADLDAQNMFRYRLLIKSLINTNQKDIAIKYLDTFFIQAVKTLNNLNPEKLKEISEKYDTEKKQREIIELQQQNLLQRIKVSSQQKLNIALISISLLSLILAVLIIKNIRQKRKLQLIAERQKADLEKTHAVETERYRISSELHDDLGSGLSTIRLLSEMMKENYSGDNIEIQLDKISDSSKELVQKMNEIVWALNVNNDNLQSLLAYIRQYSVKALDDVGITCIFNMPGNIPIMAIAGNERRHIFLMVKECVHNIIKHSKASEVIIEMALHENISIQIADNGIGFSCSENGVNHFGLNNLKQRAKELNGNIEWRQNNGTEVYIQIPLSSISHKSAIA